MEKAVRVLEEIPLDNCPTQVLFNYEIYSPRHKFTAHNAIKATMAFMLTYMEKA